MTKSKSSGSIRRQRLILMAAAVGAASALGAKVGRAATITWDGGAASDANWSSPFNWDTNSVPLANDSLVFSGFTRVSNNNDLAAATAFNGITFAPVSGAFTLAGNSITLGGDITDNTTLLTQTISLPLVLNATRTLSVADQGFLSLSGIISGTGFGLNKTGLGTATLSGANTFTGPISISGGVLSVGAANNLGGATASDAITIANATLRATGNFAIPSTRGITLGPAGSNGSGTFDVATGNSLSYSGVIANNTGDVASLNKVKFGTLVLGGANTYTGATNVRNGGLTLNFADAAAPQNNIIDPGSNLVLGGQTAGIGQTSNATLTATGKASTANVQTFASTNFDIYGSVVTSTNGATGGTMKVNLGAITHTLGGTAVIPTNGGTVTTTTTVGATNGILGGWAIGGTGSTPGTRGITMGTDWATVGPDNGDGTHNIIAYTGYVAAPIYDGTTNNTFNGNTTLQANANKNVQLVGTAASQEMRVDLDNANSVTDINTFAFSSAGTNNTLTIGAGNTLRLGQYGGIMKQNDGNNQVYIGGAGGLVTGNGSGSNIGNLTAGGPVAGTPGEIVLTNRETSGTNGTLNVLAKIVDNKSAPNANDGAVTLIKTGVSSVKIDGHNTFSGGTFINQGRLQLAGNEANATGGANPDGLGTGPVTVAPGAYLFLSAINSNTIFTGNGAIAGAVGGSAQNAPVVNDMFLSGNGTSQEGGGSIRFGNRSILLGTVTLTGDTRLFGGNAQAYPKINDDQTTLYFDPGNEIRGKITGNFNLDIGGRAVAGLNMMISNSANDWGGNTTLLGTNGNARLRLGANEVIPDGPGKGNLVMGENSGSNTGVLDMQRYSETINGLSTAGGTAITQSFVENDGFTATVTDPTPEDPNNGDKAYVYSNATSTLTVGNFDQTASFGGIIRDFDTAASFTLPDPNNATTNTVTITAPGTTALANSKVALTKIGSGVQTLSAPNTYSGVTNINGGTLSVTGSLLNTGTVNINSGGTLGGSGSVGNVTLNPGGHIAPGTSVGTITLANLVGSNGDLSIEFGASNNVGIADLVNVQGGTTFTGSISVTPSGSPLAGTYTVLHSSSAIAGGASFTLGTFPTLPDTRPASGALDLSSPNDIKVVISGGAKILNWTGANGSVWDKGTGGTVNWFDTIGSVNEKFFNGDLITFGDGPTNRNITLNLSVSPGSVTFANSTGNDYTVSGSGAIIGLGTVTQSGSGTTTISTNNSFSGNISTNNGTLVLSGTNVANAVTNGGTLKIVDGGTVGAVTNNATLELNTVAGRTFSSAISGGGQVNKTGTGKLTLTGTNSGSGATNVQAGILTMTSFTTLGTGTTTISPGAQLDLGAITGTNVAGGFGARPFRISGAGPDGSGAIVNTGNNQQNAFQNVALDADATVGGPARWDIRGGAAQLDLGNHILTKIGTNQVSVVAGNITDGSIVVNGGTLSIETSTVVSGSNGTITFNPTTTGQFFGNTGDVSRPLVFNDNTILTNGTTTAAGTVASPVTFNGQTTVNINGAATAGFTMNGFITGSGGFTKTGTGALTLGNQSGSASNWTGGTTISAGSITASNSGSLTGNVTNNAALTVEFNNALGNVDGTGSTALGDGGNTSITSASHVRQSSLNLTTNSTLVINPSGGVANGVSNVGNLTVGPFARIDLGDNKLITNNAVGTWTGSNYDGVAGLIQTGRNGGGWNGSSGILTSQSTAAAGSFTSIGLASAQQVKGLATATDTGVWAGQTVTGSQTLVMYTYGGDANLDGKINVDDYGRIDFNVNLGVAGWFNGDFNYDGKINVDDYGIIDFNVGIQGAPFFTAGGASAASAASSGLSGVSAVPEPASLSLLSLGAAALLGGGRRRRRRAAC